MKSRFRLFVSSLGFISAVCIANTNINMTANVVSTSCKVTLDNSGSIDLGTVDYNYLNTNTAVDRVYTGGQAFYITVSVGATNQQVFANQAADGAKNVGIVILSTQDAQSIFNVLDTHGQPQSIYPVSADQLVNATYHFYARMQKIDLTQAATGGVVRASVFVGVYYE